MSDYKPISCDYHSVLEHYVVKQLFCRLQYYSEIKEFVTVQTVLKDLYTEHGQEFLVILDGTKIRLDQIVRVDDKAAPGLGDDYFKCDC